MTLEDLEVIEKNYKKVYEEELQKIYALYPNAKEEYEKKNQVVINVKPKKTRFFFFKKRKQENMIKINSK